eukprot:Tbor_TRINITY_DN4929_c5_g1::TRINITY_DN4929_c5_g1_i3::g.9720::m.9720
MSDPNTFYRDTQYHPPNTSLLQTEKEKTINNKINNNNNLKNQLLQQQEDLHQRKSLLSIEVEKINNFKNIQNEQWCHRNAIIESEENHLEEIIIKEEEIIKKTSENEEKIQEIIKEINKLKKEKNEVIPVIDGEINNLEKKLEKFDNDNFLLEKEINFVINNSEGREEILNNNTENRYCVNYNNINNNNN